MYTTEQELLDKAFPKEEGVQYFDESNLSEQAKKLQVKVRHLLRKVSSIQERAHINGFVCQWHRWLHKEASGITAEQKQAVVHEWYTMFGQRLDDLFTVSAIHAA